METQEKIKALLKAIDFGIISSVRSQLNDSHGYCKKLRNGETIPVSAIDMLYSNLEAIPEYKMPRQPGDEAQKEKSITLQTNKKAKPEHITEKTKEESITSITLQTGKDSEIKSELQAMKEQIALLTQENKELKEKVEELSARLTSITEKKESITLQKISNDESITPSITASITNGIKKRESQSCLGFSICRDKKGRYSGVKRVKDKKMVSVYIGQDLGQAEQKIRAYCERHGIQI